MDNANVDVYPKSILEVWEQYHFNLDFPKLDHLKAIVREHGGTLFQPFDQEGLRVESLKQGKAVRKLQDATLPICT